MPGRGARWAATLVALVALAAAAAPAGAKVKPVAADYFNQSTPALKKGQIELRTVSTLPEAVTGGQVLIEVRGLSSTDTLRVLRNGRKAKVKVTTPSSGVRRALLSGLRDGSNTVVAQARRGKKPARVATLTVVNHPISGPVLSGPHQTPFFCETEAAGLGKPLDANCSVKTTYTWYARSNGQFSKLADPYAPYPSGTETATTKGGKQVPFVVRVESSTINRGISRIAVLDDPAKRGKGKPFDGGGWTGGLTYVFGESCGVGYRQGSNSESNVLGGAPTGAEDALSGLYGLSGRLARGDAVSHSTLTTFGVDCNQLVSGETLMMVKEHVAETYGGPVGRTVGVGGSGGALQIYNAINNFPGLLDGALPIATFTDVVSTAQTVVDCGLLSGYWNGASGWSDEQKTAVSGHLSTSICKDWGDLFLSRLDPANGCDGAVPKSARYDAKTNPKGARCTLQDSIVNVVGKDPATGFARRPYDNVGIQYGLGALKAGTITADQFVDLNRRIGGYDIDGKPQAQRSAMPVSLASDMYRFGGVVGRGAIARTPVIDLATYLDAVPVADIHDVVRPFMQRARLRKWQGSDRSQSIWRGVSTQGDAYAPLESWLDSIDAGAGHTVAAVRGTQPAAAGDRCRVGGAGSLVPLPSGVPTLSPGTDIPERQEASGSGVCQSTFTARSEPRMVAGGPLADDVIKCTLKPVDPADYGPALSAAQLDQLRQAFPSGVCDYSKPGAGEVSKSVVWPSVGGTRLEKAHALTWTVARSR
jgi:hypothetical protein